jgi:hypothetical protein
VVLAYGAAIILLGQGRPRGPEAGQTVRQWLVGAILDSSLGGTARSATQPVTHE